jgi:hypothetical protein
MGDFARAREFRGQFAQALGNVKLEIGIGAQAATAFDFFGVEPGFERRPARGDVRHGLRFDRRLFGERQARRHRCDEHRRGHPPNCAAYLMHSAPPLRASRQDLSPPNYSATSARASAGERSVRDPPPTAYRHAVKRR